MFVYIPNLPSLNFFTFRIPAHMRISESEKRVFQWEKPNNRFEDMEMTVGGSYSMSNFWSELERTWNLQEWSTKKPQSLRVPFFGHGIFKGCCTPLWNHSCNKLRFSQNFQDKPRNFSRIFTKAFSQPPCSVFFLEQTTDRQTFFFGYWDTLPTALPYNIFLNLPKIKPVTDYIQNIRISPVSQ